VFGDCLQGSCLGADTQSNASEAGLLRLLARLLGIVWLGGVGLVAGPAAWGSVCPQVSLLGNPLLPVPTPRLLELQQQVDKAPLACLEDPDFLALKGRLLSLGPDPSQGMVYLEKAVLTAPERPDLLLEYAAVAEASRNYSLARSLVQQVLASPGLPEGLGRSLSAWQQQLASQQGLRLGHRQSRAWVSLGFDSNLNSGLSASALRLSLPAGEVVLPLSDQDRPIEGGFSQLQMQHLAVLDFDSQSWVRTGLSATAREPFSGSRLSAQSLEVWGAAQPALLQSSGIADWLSDPAELGVRLGASWFGGSVLSEYQGLTLQWPVGVGRQIGQALPASYGPGIRCSSLALFDLEHRGYPSRNDFNALVAQWGGLFNCQSDRAGLQLQLQLALDHALAQRPGGDTWRLLGQIGMGAEWAAYTVLLRLALSYSVDQKGYSALLEDNAEREVWGWQLGLDAGRPLAEGLIGRVKLEAFRQMSNLGLFALRGHRVFLGLEWIR
jgi:hypothetical protein